VRYQGENRAKKNGNLKFKYKRFFNSNKRFKPSNQTFELKQRALKSNQVCIFSKIEIWDLKQMDYKSKIRIKFKTKKI
jgi:hypothetical protein